jgi:large conductance mechanosensitive channel
MKIVNEFKSFIMRGNVIDLAVGIVVGAAFGKIVTSLVSDIIMPPIGLLIGGVNFTDLKWVMKEGQGEIPAVTLNYGNFIQICFDFLIVAMAIFLLIKGINSAKRKQETPQASTPTPTGEEVLLREIRDLLKK